MSDVLWQYHHCSNCFHVVCVFQTFFPLWFSVLKPLPLLRNGAALCTVLCRDNQTTYENKKRDYLNRFLQTHLPWYNLLVNLYRLVCKEGGVTGSHLIYQHSQSPPIHCFIVTLENTKEIKGSQICPQTKTHTLQCWRQTVSSILYHRSGGFLNEIPFENSSALNTKNGGVNHGPSRTLTLLRMISGARYSGVPQSVQVRPFTLFANPKSVTWGEEKGHSSEYWPHSVRKQRPVKQYLLLMAKKTNMQSLPVCNLAGRWAGSPASDLGRWDPVSEGIRRSVQSGLRRSGRVVHCKTDQPRCLQSTNSTWKYLGWNKLKVYLPESTDSP